jgi:hypothetical protein
MSNLGKIPHRFAQSKQDAARDLPFGPGVAREFDIDYALIAGRYTLLKHEPLDSAFAELQERTSR